MAKRKEVKVRMQSSESHYYYTTDKNPKKKSIKMRFKKYDPIIRKHVFFDEAKLAKAS